jgi:hypothetical protein
MPTASVPPANGSSLAASAAASSAAESPLVAFAEGVWLGVAPVRFLGMRLTSTMVVLRLADGSLLVDSPVALTSERRAAVQALGRVAHLYAPNLFHHLWMGDWAAAFPAACVHAPQGLARKHRGLRIDRIHGPGAGPAPFGPTVDEIPVEGFRLRETALYHRPSRTLVLADVVHNVGRPAHPWTATYTRAMGFYDRVAVSRALRWTAFQDRPAARRSINALIDHAADRLVLGHGDPLEAGGRTALARAYTWLRPRSAEGRGG